MPVTLTLEERKHLETVAASRTTPHRQVQRARLGLACGGDASFLSVWPVAAIMDYIRKFNTEGRIFRWTKTAEAIITSVNNLTGH